MGDSVDNIPGAPGIGEKGARDLIRKFGSLENLLANTGQVERNTYRQSLEENREQILQSKRLVTIDTQVPLSMTWQDLQYQLPNIGELRELFLELGFQSMLKEFEIELPKAETVRSFVPVTTTGQLNQLILDLQQESFVCIYPDFEGQLSSPRSIRSVACAGSTKGWLVRLQDDSTIQSHHLRALWEDPKISKVFHNAKVLQTLLLKQGVTLEGLQWDTTLMSYMAYPTRNNHQFEELTFALLEKTPSEDPCERCMLLKDLFELLRSKLEESCLEKPFREIDLPLSAVLAQMELSGIRVDCVLLRKLSTEFERQMEALARRIYEGAGAEFNLNSPRQLGEILFDRLNLPAPKKLKKSGQYSTSVEVLEVLGAKFELPRLMLEYRQLAKLKSGYIDALPQLLNPETNRVHTSFNQTVAATGRLSSSNPNLQNIPIRSEMGTKIRSAFVPSEGCVLMSADYSQIELRVLAHLSNDAVLTESFQKGEDIHTRTAAEVFGTHPGMQTGELRRRAKVINFGIVYGQTPFGLAKELGIPQREAQEFIRRYFDRYAGVKRFIDETILETRRTLISRTLFGRVRPIPDINSKNPAARSFAERTAVNSPIQGTAADLIKLAMIRIHERLAKSAFGAKMLLQVHDELVFDVPEGEVPAMRELVKSEMENVYQLRVPLLVEIGTGSNWMET
jgi:DNA polymerase-1